MGLFQKEINQDFHDCVCVFLPFQMEIQAGGELLFCHLAFPSSPVNNYNHEYIYAQEIKSSSFFVFQLGLALLGMSSKVIYLRNNYVGNDNNSSSNR